MRVLITGDRNWTDRDRIRHIFKYYIPRATLILGDCPTGADAIAKEIAEELGMEIDGPHKANWKEYGRAAGPIRNRAMVGRNPNVALAFHDDLSSSRGTADCVRQAKKADVPVIEVTTSTPYKTICRAFCGECGSQNLVWEAWGSYLDKDLICQNCGHTVDVWDC